MERVLGVEDGVALPQRRRGDATFLPFSSGERAVTVLIEVGLHRTCLYEEL
ncbi:MAG: hypothetical protein ACSLEW_07630 [Nocardioides sp.]